MAEKYEKEEGSEELRKKQRRNRRRKKKKQPMSDLTPAILARRVILFISWTKLYLAQPGSAEKRATKESLRMRKRARRTTKGLRLVVTREEQGGQVGLHDRWS